MAQSLGAVVGLAGGILAGLLGAIFTAASWIVGNEGARHWLSAAGTTMLSLTIPFIIFGGYCLDWMEKNKSLRHSDGDRPKSVLRFHRRGQYEVVRDQESGRAGGH